MRNGIAIGQGDLRWRILPYQELESKFHENYQWFYEITNRQDTLTKLSLAYDEVVKRPVIVKNICYRKKDIVSKKIEERRKYLREQVNILNDISSILLPEPLDWINVINTTDNLGKEYEGNEPILILDYIPGVELKRYIKEDKFLTKDFNHIDKGEMNVNRIIALCKKILAFLKVLEEKGYGVVGLSDEHIILLKDDVPRFVGISHLCKLNNGFLDINHINFERTIYGYSAPELNDYSMPRNNITGRQSGAFSLGVLLHQMICSKVSFNSKDIKGGAFIYPNGDTVGQVMSINDNMEKGEALHLLIRDLCNHEISERLYDYDEIEKRLQDIEDIKGNESLDNHEEIRFCKKSILAKLKDMFGLV